MNKPATDAVVLEVRAEMARQQLTIADMSERCGLSVPQLNRRLTGTVELTMADALLISDGLGVALSTLIARAEQAKAAA